MELLAIAQDPTLAELYARRRAGEALTPAEVLRVGGADAALVFGFENMLRLYEEGLIDPDVWNNVLHNSMPFLGSAFFRGFLATRPGPLSKRPLVAIEKLPHLYPPEAA